MRTLSPVSSGAGQMAPRQPPAVGWVGGGGGRLEKLEGDKGITGGRVVVVLEFAAYMDWTKRNTVSHISSDFSVTRELKLN